MNKNKTLNSILLLYNFYKIPIEAETLIHKYNLESKELNELSILKMSKDIGLKCKKIKNRKDKFDKLPLPCLAEGKDGDWFLIAKASDEKILLFNYKENENSTLTYDEFYEIYNNKLIIFKQQNKELRDLKFNIKWFIPTIVKYKKQLVQILIAAFTIQLFGLVTPVIMQVIIDKVLVHNSMITLNTIMVILAIITLFELMMTIARVYVFTDTTNKIDVILGARLFKHLVHLPLAYFENRRVGDTIARVKELENIRRFLTGTPLSTIIDLLFINVYIFVMFMYSTKLTLVVILSLPVFAIISLTYTPIFKKRLDEKFKAGAESQAFMVETVTGIGTVKTMALEPKFESKWDSLLSKYTRSNYKISTLSGNLNAIIMFTQKVFNLIILWVGVNLVITHDITVGQFIAFRMLSGNVTQPILRITQLWQELQQSSVSIDRIGDIFNSKPEVDVESNKTRLAQIQGEIKFENVTFRYRNDKPEVIRNISFTIPKGKVIGFVGRSGSGKSTVGKLIQRLYIPERGKILVDGVDTSIVDTDWLRSQIGVVMQESFLFGGTIRENIAINHPAASIDEIMKVCHIAGAHEFIIGLPQAYDTVVGENGTGLSGGQKQRIAIARALLGNPRILVFDEATSALDYESESIIQNNIEEICKGRTVIMIAHRLSTLQNADAILVMDKGNIIEYGPQKKLLQNEKGLYYHLHNQQFRNKEGK